MPKKEVKCSWTNIEIATQKRAWKGVDMQYSIYLFLGFMNARVYLMGTLIGMEAHLKVSCMEFVCVIILKCRLFCSFDGILETYFAHTGEVPLKGSFHFCCVMSSKCYIYLIVDYNHPGTQFCWICKLYPTKIQTKIWACGLHDAPLSFHINWILATKWRGGSPWWLGWWL